MLRLAALLWIASLTVGISRLMVYDSTPAPVTIDTTSQWPRTSTIRCSTTHNIVVMAAHPHCPCTRASIAELARVMAACPEKTEAVVLFTVPPGMPPDWEKTDLWRSAAAIPGVRVLRDAGGAEAARFGAVVSGQCFCFSPAGRRLFSGGITLSRGHEGDNARKDALIRALSEDASPDPAHRIPGRSTPVFGCALAVPTRSEIL